jgi:hypothetical protein
VPKGTIQASSTFHVVVLNFHFCSTPTPRALKINNRKSAPCIGPIILVREGLFAPYFRGTAIHTSTNSDMPSKKPSIRNLPMFVLNSFIIIIFLMGLINSDVWAVCQWRKWPRYSQ